MTSTAYKIIQIAPFVILGAMLASLFRLWSFLLIFSVIILVLIGLIHWIDYFGRKIEEAETKERPILPYKEFMARKKARDESFAAYLKNRGE